MSTGQPAAGALYCCKKEVAEMELAPLLGIQRGVTAIIGSGGKTTLLRTLADELPGRVLLCTSTHFLGYRDLPTVLDPTEPALQDALRRNRIVCAAGRSSPSVMLPKSSADGEAVML